MSAQPVAQQVITANRLDDGRVVFVDADNRWVADLQSARLLGDDAEAALAQVDASVVVEAYLIEVERAVSGVQPVLIRERIRASGPSVETGSALQASHHRDAA